MFRVPRVRARDLGKWEMHRCIRDLIGVQGLASGQLVVGIGDPKP